MKKVIQWTVGGLLPLLMISQAPAAIVSGSVDAGMSKTSGGVFELLGPQATVGGDDIPSASYNLRGMNELSGVTLGSALAVNGGTIAAGTKVASHLVWSDSLTTSNIEGKVLFDRKILGVILKTSRMTSSNFLGLVATTYLNAVEWGMEPGNTYAGLTEGVVISGTNEITFTGTGIRPDYVRVITAVPEPGSLALLCMASVAMVGVVRRRRNKAKVA